MVGLTTPLPLSAASGTHAVAMPPSKSLLLDDMCLAKAPPDHSRRSARVTCSKAADCATRSSRHHGFMTTVTSSLQLLHTRKLCSCSQLAERRFLLCAAQQHACYRSVLCRTSTQPARSSFTEGRYVYRYQCWSHSCVGSTNSQRRCCVLGGAGGEAGGCAGAGARGCAVLQFLSSSNSSRPGSRMWILGTAAA